MKYAVLVEKSVKIFTKKVWKMISGSKVLFLKNQMEIMCTGGRVCSDWRSFISASQHLNVRRGQELKIGSAFLITASAERDDFTGGETDIVAVAFRLNVMDILQIYNIAVVAAKKQVFWKFLKDIRYFSGPSDDLIFTVEDQVSVVSLYVIAPGVIESMIALLGRQPQSGFRYSDLWPRSVILDSIFQLPEQFPAFFFGNFTDCDMDFIHDSSRLFCKA